MRTLSLVLVASLVLGTSSAVAQTVPNSAVQTGRASVSLSLAAQASRHAQGLMISDARFQEGTITSSATNGQPDEDSIRKAALIIGLAGVGTAVTGAYLWRNGSSNPNLPGIQSGGRTTGQIMVGVGGIFAVLGLVRAMK